MPRQSCPRCRAPVSSVPGPLYGRVECPAEEPAPVVLPIPARRAEEAEMRICRHKSLIPAPADPALGEVLCQLRRQNELLLEILAAINSLTAATLARGR